MDRDVDAQRAYYACTAACYDDMHVHGADVEHEFALSFLVASLRHLDAKSVLDVGSGTGRALRRLAAQCPEIRAVGVEPVAALRRVGHEAGIPSTQLVDGDATRLAYADGSFDVVCEFGAFHHIKHPERAVAEMLRVAKIAVFISDSNNFGQGSHLVRLAKQALNALGLWRAADFVKTKGKGYTISDGDGLAYSYSVFNNYDQIRRACRRVHLLNTRDGDVNPYRTASHVALLGIKA